MTKERYDWKAGGKSLLLRGRSRQRTDNVEEKVKMVGSNMVATKKDTRQVKRRYYR